MGFIRLLGWMVLCTFFILHPSTLTLSPQSLAQKLQTQFLSAPAVAISFDLKNQGHILITVDLRSGGSGNGSRDGSDRIRLESPTLLIISDGETVWSYDKTADRETIDNVTAGSEFHDPASLFRFADNYTAQIAASNGKTRYTLVLTPSQALQSLLKSAGAMQSLRLDLELHGSRVVIRNASATTSRGTTQIEHLHIKMLKQVPTSEFNFTPKASTKVIDLRE